MVLIRSYVLAVATLLALPIAGGWAADQWTVIDPSGQSRTVLLVVDGQAIEVQTVPLTRVALPQPPPIPPDEPPPPPPPDEPPPVPIEDVFGFVALAKSAGSVLSGPDRAKIATVYMMLGDRFAEFPDHSVMYSQSTQMISALELDPAGVAPFLEAVHARMADHWNTDVDSPTALAAVFRELAYGLGGSTP